MCLDGLFSPSIQKYKETSIHLRQSTADQKEGSIEIWLGEPLNEKQIVLLGMEFDRRVINATKRQYGRDSEERVGAQGKAEVLS